MKRVPLQLCGEASVNAFEEEKNQEKIEVSESERAKTTAERREEKRGNWEGNSLLEVVDEPRHNRACFCMVTNLLLQGTVGKISDLEIKKKGMSERLASTEMT